MIWGAKSRSVKILGECSSCWYTSHGVEIGKTNPDLAWRAMTSKPKLDWTA